MSIFQIIQIIPRLHNFGLASCLLTDLVSNIPNTDLPHEILYVQISFQFLGSAYQIEPTPIFQNSALLISSSQLCQVALISAWSCYNFTPRSLWVQGSCTWALQLGILATRKISATQKTSNIRETCRIKPVLWLMLHRNPALTPHSSRNNSGKSEPTDPWTLTVMPPGGITKSVGSEQYIIKNPNLRELSTKTYWKQSGMQTTITVLSLQNY